MSTDKLKEVILNIVKELDCPYYLYTEHILEDLITLLKDYIDYYKFDKASGYKIDKKREQKIRRCIILYKEADIILKIGDKRKLQIANLEKEAAKLGYSLHKNKKKK